MGCYVVMDKGYDRDEYREELGENNNIAAIAGRSNRKVGGRI